MSTPQVLELGPYGEDEYFNEQGGGLIPADTSLPPEGPGEYWFSFEIDGWWEANRAHVIAELEAWVSIVKADPNFRGQVGDIFVIPQGNQGFAIARIPVWLTADDLAAVQSHPFGSSSLVPILIPLAWWVGIFIAGALAVVAVSIAVNPNGVARVAATGGLFFVDEDKHPALVAIAKDPAPELPLTELAVIAGAVLLLSLKL